MLVEDTTIYHGGLMRCCLVTLMDHIHSVSENPPEGTTLDCRYEERGNESMIFKDGGWRWNREKHFPH